MLVSESALADILSISKRNIESRIAKGELKPSYFNGDKNYFSLDMLTNLDIVSSMVNSKWDKEILVKPAKNYTSVELFAGAGGLALGLEKAGFKHVVLNELDKNAARTLQSNIKNSILCTNIDDIQKQLQCASYQTPIIANHDVSKVDFKSLRGKIDLLSGGFPCQAFSYAGQKRGFEDTRGTLFFEFARALNEIEPPAFLAENVRGLQNHDDGRTIATIKNVVDELGYVLIEPKVLKAIFHRVPQKRERLIMIGVKKEIAERFDITRFNWPSPCNHIYTLKDALKASKLFNSDVPESEGQKYPARKKEIMQHVPQGGYWRDLPEDLQKEYMKGSFFLGGGKTGMARRLSWDEPSLTLTTSPAQKQTERCHPEFNRPLTYREYARVQTFPDYWKFEGSLTSKYKQIGNAVPVNLAERLGNSIVRFLNEYGSI